MGILTNFESPWAMLLLIDCTVGLTIVKLIITSTINKTIKAENMARKIIKGFFTGIIIFFFGYNEIAWDISKILINWR